MQGNEELKKRQMLSAQIDLSKFNKGDFIKATEEEKKQDAIEEAKATENQAKADEKARQRLLDRATKDDKSGEDDSGSEEND